MLEPPNHPAEPDDDLTGEELLEAAVAAELEVSPGEETIEEAKRHLVLRIAQVVAGFVVLCIGIALLALPGPGLLVVALGLGLMASEVPFARRLLVQVRRRLPADDDGKLPKSTIAMMVLVCTVTVGLSVWWSFLR